MPEPLAAPPTLFDPASLQRHLDATLATVPAEHDTALVGYYTTDGVWRVTLARRLNRTWLCGATFGKDQAAGRICGGVFIRGSW